MAMRRTPGMKRGVSILTPMRDMNRPAKKRCGKDYRHYRSSAGVLDYRRGDRRGGSAADYGK